MKKITIVSAMLCMSLLASGCTGKPKTLSSQAHVSNSTAVTTEAVTTKAATGSHTVSVEELSKDSYTDEYNDTYTSVYPKIIVDGKEAAEINESLKSFIQKTYPLRTKTEYGYLEGYEITYSWGANANTISVIIRVSAIKSDYYTNEVFNYDLDTLKTIDDSEVVKRLGMTDDEFFSKTAEVLKKEMGENRTFDLDKTLSSLNYDKLTPMITPDGNPGVLAALDYAAGEQFGGLVNAMRFDLKAMKRF